MKISTRRRLILMALIAVIIILTVSAMMMICPLSCGIRGYANSECRVNPVVPDQVFCNPGELNIGTTMDCNAGGMIGSSYSCCCS